MKCSGAILVNGARTSLSASVRSTLSSDPGTIAKAKHRSRCGLRRTGCPARSFFFCEKFFGGGVGLFVGLLFQLLVDAPLVTEGIEDLSVTCSPKKILQRHKHLGARGHRPLDGGVGVFDL